MKRTLLLSAAMLLPSSAYAQQDHSAHQGHDMPAEQTKAESPPVATDPHAGHGMGNMEEVPAEPADPHAGHDMSAMPADDSAESDVGDVGDVSDVGDASAPAPPGDHAADAVFGAEVMAQSRKELAYEVGGMGYSLVMLDIDDFRSINDEEGRKAGDRKLMEVAEVLEKQGLSDLPYRLGDDDFALLMPGSHYEAAVSLAEELSTELHQKGTRASIGVSTMRLGVRGEVVEAEAAAALKEARRRGGGNFVHFEELRGEVNVAQPDKIEAVRHLIAEEGLTTAFQPIWSFETQEVMGSRPSPGRTPDTG